jgi:endonuclease/exonuclease/phosphatase (EEP) superfamily protein YafD
MPLQSLDPTQIRVLSWNIAKGRHHDWRRDLLRLSHNTDLALIQEARLEHAMHQVMPDSCWAFAPGYQRQNVTTGVLTISRAETVERFLHSHREPLTGLPKAALVTEYRLTGSAQTLLVANVHAINFTPGTGHFHRQLLSVAHRIAHHQGPLILCGDFNTWRHKRQRILDELIIELGLKAVHIEQDHRRQAFGLALDHIFYRGLSYKTCVVDRVHTSDHNPITAVLGICD